MECPSIIAEVYDVFKHYYGEDRVDLQYIEGRYTIFIHWNEVDITNEIGESTRIYDLYAKLGLTSSGTLADRFLFLKATYTKEHFEARYIHSHIPSLGRSNINTWTSSCLGSGPIRNTLTKCREHVDLNDYLLLAFELDKYVHVESLTGGPHYRMSRIGQRSTTPINLSYNNSGNLAPMMKEFIKYLIQSKALKYVYLKGKYTFGMSQFEFIYTCTNKFVEWNETRSNKVDLKWAISNSYLIRATIEKENFARIVQNLDNSLDSYIGTTLFRFKGKDVKLKVVGTIAPTNDIYILHPDKLGLIYKHILLYLNTYYGKSISPDTSISTL